MEKFLVFVYGTLLRGYSNHRLLENPVGFAEFVGTGKTTRKYTMYSAGIPFVSDEKETSFIEGELFEVDEAVLKDLDRLEGHPDFYERKHIPVSCDQLGTVVGAWLYFCTPRYGASLVESGNFKDVRDPVSVEFA